MSAIVLKIVPALKDYVPTEDRKLAALEMMKEQFPEGHSHQAEVFERLEFIDQGENLEEVICPICGTRTPINPFTESDPGENWYLSVFESLSSVSIEDFKTSMPCCGRLALFTDLAFSWPAGFARFELCVWDPDFMDVLPREFLSELEQAVGCGLIVVWAHY